MKISLQTHKYTIAVSLCLGMLFMLIWHFLTTAKDSLIAVPIQEMKITFTDRPVKTIDQEKDTVFSTVINGSYFWQTSTGSYFPAGLWKENGKILSPIDPTDPNLSQIVTYSHSGNTISVSANRDYQDTSCATECTAFQAGPLIASGGTLLSDYGGSWHANEAHERTILGASKSWTPVLFVSTDKITLRDAWEKILQQYPDITTLINLDGGPSTAVKTPNRAFREEKILPILLHIR